MKASRGGKGEGKGAMEPLFPRLHVNDREKGGPRAPPRNKMALYEQLSIPSKRPNSSAPPPVPPRQAGSSTTPLASEAQANGYKQPVLSPLNMSPNSHSNSEARVHSRASDRANLNTMRTLNTTRTEFERSFKRHASSSTVSARKSVENFEDEDDLRVPVFIHSEIAVFADHDLPALQPGKVNSFHVEEKDTNTFSRTCEQNCKETSVSANSPEIPDSRRFAQPSNRDGTSHLPNCGDGRLSRSRCSNRVDVVEEEGDSRNIVESCSKASFAEKANESDQENLNKSNHQEQLGDMDINEVSGDSMTSIAAMMISPDDVVGVIGTKHFWKARRAIVNQQRVFSIQVFELHRLIKVQKLIAASPDVIKIDLELSPSPKPVSENSQPEHTCGSPRPLNDLGRSHLPTTEQNNTPRCEISSTAPHSVESAPESGPSTFVFHPPPNQWLVPVMSPSEGLIYKPYSGPCPPVSCFMPPLYGGCAPLGFQGFQPVAVGGDFMSSAYNAPLPYQQPPNCYPSLCSSAVEQVAPPLAGSSSHPTSEAVSGRVRKLHDQIDREVQRSVSGSVRKLHDQTDSKVQQSAASSKPRDGQASDSCGQDGRGRVIKVVPHNAGSATESAARIFLSIQRERQQSRS